MKNSELILIFSLFIYCLTQEIDECSVKFEEILQQKCLLIDGQTCEYNSELQKCGDKCSSGNSNTCTSLIPPNHSTHNCEYTSGACQPVQQFCAAYYGYDVHECSKYKSPDGADYRCYIAYNGGSCSSYSNKCAGFNSDQSNCENHVPFPYTNKCVYSETTTGSTTQKRCTESDRYCDDNYYGITADICHSLKSTSGKACFFNGGSCREDYEGCKGYDELDCGRTNGEYPRKQTESGDDYDYLNKCYWSANTGTSGECVSRRRKCYEFDDTNDDEKLCLQLEAIDPSKKKCIYDGTKCIEEYKSCKLYNDNESVKNREECERIIPEDSTKLCYFNEEGNQCEERDIFTNCEDYKGNDKSICESIISKATNSRCILEKDSTCKERTFNCTDTNIKYQCLTYAKPSDSSKKCVFDSGKCLEVYKTCEDYLENNEYNCNHLNLYDGKQCFYDSNRCRSKNRVCLDALSEDECKLIAETGVSDPDRKICDYVSFSDPTAIPSVACIENYKYCSDYRGDDSYVCQDIKPYDESGKNLDITSYCKMDTSIGCKRVSYKCSHATNEFECASISPYIKDNKIKYCAYHHGSPGGCREYYKNCEDASPSECSSNIPEGYSQSICSTMAINGVKKCVKNNDCSLFTPSFYSNLCYSIAPNCTYSGSKCITDTSIKCNTVKFYIASDKNEETCRTFELSNPNKVCSLKEDKLGCEEIDKESIPSEPSNQESSSKILKMEIYLIMFLLSILI